jgi:hypothetical protein
MPLALGACFALRAVKFCAIAQVNRYSSRWRLGELTDMTFCRLREDNLMVMRS